MNKPTFPVPTSEIQAVLIEIFEHQKNTSLVELLRNAHVYIDFERFDNWNGGTNFWCLRLELPLSIFAKKRGYSDSIEKSILAQLGYLSRVHPTDTLESVILAPLPKGQETSKQPNLTETDASRIWVKNRFRLFLSHVSTHKLKVAKLKDELEIYGITAFVAHEDIKPTEEWCAEIENALQSMHALVAVLTEDFHKSKWTDHEIGWALGRGLLVIPLRAPLDPYGFAGKYQGLQTDLSNPKLLASKIVDILIQKTRTHIEMRRSLIEEFVESNSYAQTAALLKKIQKLTNFSENEKTSLLKSCEENSQVRDSFGVPNAIRHLLGIKPKKKSSIEEALF